MKYTVVENPPPFTQGATTVSSIVVKLNNNQSYVKRANSRLTDTPIYNVTQIAAPIKTKETIINNTVVNQEITIINEGSTKVAAQYNNLSAMTNINNRRQFINDGLGTNTYDDNTTPIWSTLINQINCSMPKKFLEVILSYTLTTDTLGGSFEIEAYDGTAIEVIEEDITIQQQDYSTRFRIITNQDSITNGIKFFITPELGMTLNITNFSLLIIKD